jgi:transposase
LTNLPNGELFMKLTTYNPEFLTEAVTVVLAQGLSRGIEALRLDISKGALGNLVSVVKRSGDPAAAPGSRSVSELEAEVGGERQLSWPAAKIVDANQIGELRKGLAVKRMEKEVLKRQGSLASGNPHAGSDDDLIVIGLLPSNTHLLEALLPAWDKLGRVVNSTSYKVDKFTQRVRDEQFFIVRGLPYVDLE